MKKAADSCNCSPRPEALRLEDFAALRVSGADRRDFLQGQLTQDMDQVTPDRAAPAAWCNRQGRVLCFAAAIEWDDATFLVLPVGMAQTCAEGLGRYVLRAEVRIEASGAPVFGCVNVPATLPVAETGAPGPRPVRDNPGSGEAWACLAGPGYCAARLPGADARALMLGEPPAGFVPAAEIGWTAARWRLADIKAEIPWIEPATSGRFLAHSLNLDRSGAVSFAKGCYVGQEIVARMEYRGNPKRRMRRLQLPPEADAKPGARLEHPRLGAVTIVCAAPGEKHIEALAETRVEPSRTDRAEQP